MKTIEQINVVTDLELGERAVPEKYTAYDLRLIDGEPLGLTVSYVERLGDTLFAVDTFANRYPVNGKDAYILQPYNKSKKAK